MMNRKQRKSMSLAIVGMALLAAVMSMTSPTQALALGHWNLDEDFTPSSGLSEDGMDSSGNTDNTNEDEDSTTTDGDDEEGPGDSSSGDSTSEEEDSTHTAYHTLQACLSDIEGEQSPTEQEVQDCIDSSYQEIDNGGNTSNENTEDVEEDENGVTERVSTDDSENEDIEE
jgi:hypothetical protein